MTTLLLSSADKDTLLTVSVNILWKQLLIMFIVLICSELYTSTGVDASTRLATLPIYNLYFLRKTPRFQHISIFHLFSTLKNKINYKSTFIKKYTKHFPFPIHFPECLAYLQLLASSLLTRWCINALTAFFTLAMATWQLTTYSRLRGHSWSVMNNDKLRYSSGG